ncbi:MAG: hypothetical protein ABFS23_00360 [Pseudomonadota bacterium]
MKVETPHLRYLPVASLVILAEFCFASMGASIRQVSETPGTGQVVFGAACGWLLWGEAPTQLMVAGALLVTIAGIIATRPPSRSSRTLSKSLAET